jgi:hypothetical protein
MDLSVQEQLLRKQYYQNQPGKLDLQKKVFLWVDYQKKIAVKESLVTMGSSTFISISRA